MEAQNLHIYVLLFLQLVKGVRNCSVSFPAWKFKISSSRLNITLEEFHTKLFSTNNTLWMSNQISHGFLLVVSMVHFFGAIMGNLICIIHLCEHMSFSQPIFPEYWHAAHCFGLYKTYSWQQVPGANTVRQVVLCYDNMYILIFTCPLILFWQHHYDILRAVLPIY